MGNSGQSVVPVGINVRLVDQIAVIEIVGDIDSKSAPQIRQHVLPLVQDGHNVLLDMAGVEFMSSAGLRMLLSTYRQASGSKAKIGLVGLPEEIRETMELVGILGYFTVYGTVAEGLSALV